MLFRSANLSINIAVPVFCAVLGITTVISFSKERIQSLTALYSKKYFMKKIRRYVVPFVLTAVAAVVYINFIRIISGYGPVFNILYLILGPYGVIPPFGAAGDYFISVLFEFILFAPLLYWIYRKSPAALVIICFALDLTFEILAALFISPDAMWFMGDFAESDLLYRRMIFRYFAIISLGFFIAGEFIEKRSIDIFSKKNRFFLVLAPCSLAYLIFVSNLTSYNPAFNSSSTSVLTSPLS